MHDPGEAIGALATCANCGVPLSGTYCAQCGEKRLQPDEHSLKNVLEEWLEAVSHGEGKLLRSLRMLLLKPGLLTRDYFLGRRVPYTRPAALFFAVNVLFFLLGSARTFTTPLIVQLVNGPLPQAKQSLLMERVLGSGVPAMERASVADVFIRQSLSGRTQVLSGQDINLTRRNQDIAASRFPEQLRALSQYEERFDARTDVLARALVISLVPMLACFLWLTLARLRQGLPRQLIFATHLWSGMLLLILLTAWAITGANHLARWTSAGAIPFLIQSDFYASAIISIAALVYGYLSLRTFFRFSRAACVALTAWMLVGLYLSLELYRLMLFYVTVYSLHA